MSIDYAFNNHSNMQETLKDIHEPTGYFHDHFSTELTVEVC